MHRGWWLYFFLADTLKGCSLPLSLLFLITSRVGLCSVDSSVQNIITRVETAATEELLTVLCWGRGWRNSRIAKVVRGTEGLSYEEQLSKGLSPSEK